MISGLAAAAGGAIWSQLSVEDFMQNYLPNYLTTGRNMKADQVLNRKYFEYEMRIERQNLHRDDIRDLMELTVGRMDIYHVVGTLILTFCITWFTDAQILQADVPAWFRTLFLISNFSAVGYLILSVWLAMHASIAAHSVCVRLLTSFARLSIPSHEELKKLRIHFMPKMEEFMSVAKNTMGWLSRKKQEEKQSGAAGGSSSGTAPAGRVDPPVESGEAEARASDDSVNAAAGSPPTFSTQNPSRTGLGVPRPAVLRERDTGEDDTQHFERYNEEQKRWLGYDAYARVCMCLGMNQMLQALSYYVVGVLCRTTLSGGITAFFGVKGLSFMLLKLDIADMGEDWVEYFFVVFYMGVPTFLACGGFLVLERWEMQHETLLTLLVTPCFVLHGLWILYIALDLDLGQYCCCPGRQRPAELSGDPLPRRIRTVNYLCVCDSKQRRFADKVKEEESKGPLDELRAMREALEALVREVGENEAARPEGKELAKERASPELQAARDQLAEALDTTRARGAATGSRRGRQEFERASKAVDRFDLWQQAPKIQSTLRALQDENVRDYLSEEQKQAIEKSYQEFMQQCKDLDVLVPDPCDSPEHAAEQPRIRFNPNEFACDEWGGLPDSVWINPADGSVSWDRPDPDRRSSSFNTAMAEGAAWKEKAKKLSDPNVGAETGSVALDIRGVPPCQTSPERFEIATPGRPSSDAPRFSVPSTAAQTQPPPGSDEARPASSELLPPGAAPDILLPKRTVTMFTVGVAIWWTVAGVIHFVQTLVKFYTNPAVAVALVDRLGAYRPGHGAFFEVTSLNCNSTHLLLSDRFAHYAAERLPGTGGLASFAHLGEAGAVSELAWLRGAGMEPVAEPLVVQTPSSWRIVATAWEPCVAAANTTCDEAWLAGWDGASIEVASARRDAAQRAWRVRPEFRVHPGLGRHSGGAFVNRSLAAYHDVVALHLSPGATSLSVLLGSHELDVWNLTRGAHLGRLHLSGSYAAVCHDGEDLLLVRQQEEGPVLERARLPWAIGSPSPNSQSESERRARTSRGHFLEATRIPPSTSSPRLLEV